MIKRGENTIVLCNFLCITNVYFASCSTYSITLNSAYLAHAFITVGGKEP